jgi:hypothetical protein
MTVDDFDAFGHRIDPDKTDSEPIIDADTVLPLSVASQQFQMVAGRYSQVVYAHGENPHLPDTRLGIGLHL